MIFRQIVRILKGIAMLSFALALFGVEIGVASADTHIWDGGGGDNNWSTCANWNQTDTCPTSTDSVQFDGTSSKNSTIDGAFAGTIAAFYINAGYGGTITQARSLTASLFSQSAGTFQGGSDTLDFNGEVSINSGATFISTSGTAYFANDFSIAEGAGANAFQHNNGTVVFDSAVRNDFSLDSTNNEDAGSGISVDEIFYNVQVNKDGGGFIRDSGTETMAVLGTLTLTDGYVNTVAGSFVINTFGAISAASTYDGGPSIVKMVGSGTNAATIASGGIMPTFEVNNANATVDFTGSSSTTFAYAVTLTSGVFNQDSAPLVFSGAFSQSGGTFNGGSATLDFNNTLLTRLVTATDT